MGSVAVGNLKQFLPRMIQLIESNPLRVYLLLNSLKETIESHIRRPSTFMPHVERVFPILFKRAESKDDGVRIMVAECLGRLAIINADVIVPKIASLFKTKNAK